MAVHQGIPNTSLADLKEYLPRGYSSRVAEDMNHAYSREFVRLVATGKRKNEAIEEALITLAEQCKANNAARARRIKRILSAR